MIAAFSDADQLRRRPAPVNTSMRRTGSGICLCSEIDMCRSPHRLRTSPLRPHDERCPRNTAYRMPLAADYVLLLHGCYFLDAGRQRIDGLEAPAGRSGPADEA